MTFRSYPRLPIAYKTFLNTTTWRDIRVETIKRRGNKCEACGRGGNIHVHHASYSKIGWSKQEDNLIVLCESCHVILHYKFRRSKLFDAYPPDLKQFTERFITEQQQKLLKRTYVSNLSEGSLTTTDRADHDYGQRSLVAFMSSTSFEERQKEYQDIKVNFLAC